VLHSRSLLRAVGAILVAILLTASAAGAQSITGSVRGGSAPVIGASVRLLELDRSVVTGAKGEFAFRDLAKGSYHLFVRAAGYASVTKVVDVTSGAASISFGLVASAITLREIVVSASPVARADDDQYQSVSSKSLVDFQNSPGTSFAEKISDLPGVTVRSNGSAPTRPILRGLGDNEVLVLENGLRVGDIATYDPAHATPMEAMGISQIDVVRGPATLLYGPNTIGGLVNVITDVVPTLSDHAVSGTASIEGSSVSDQYTGFFNTVFSGGHSAFRVSAGGLHGSDIRIPSGTYTDPGTGGVFNLDRMPQTFDRSSEEGAGYSYQGAFGMIGIGGKHYEMNYGVPGDPPNADWIDIPPTTSRIAQTRDMLEMRSLFNVSSPLFSRITLNASYNDYNHSEFPTAEDSTGVSDPQANHFHKQTFNAVLQLQQHQFGKLQGTIGAWTDVENLTIEGDQPLGPNSVTTGWAGYAYEELLASPTTRLQAGVRWDYNKIQTNPYPQSTDPVFQTLQASRLSNALTASVGAVQRITPEVTASLSLASSFRAPTVQELFANGLDAASGTYSIGTSTLEPEHGFGVDASLKGNFKTVAFEFSPFLNYINNDIYAFLRGDTIQDFPVRQFGSTDARLAGFEAVVSVQAAEHLAIRASSDYVNAQDTRLDVPLPFIPPLRGLLRATYQDDKYTGMVEGRFAASQTRLGDGDTPTDGYAVFNLGFGVRLNQSRVVHNISVHIDNVFNTVYRDNLSVVKDFIPQPARGFRLNYQIIY
jgi:iron complex outermembrane receptor protein